MRGIDILLLICLRRYGGELDGSQLLQTINHDFLHVPANLEQKIKSVLDFYGLKLPMSKNEFHVVRRRLQTCPLIRYIPKHEGDPHARVATFVLRQEGYALLDVVAPYATQDEWPTLAL